MDDPAIEHDRRRNDEASLDHEVSDQALEAAAQEICATSGYWACPTAD